MGLKKTKFDDTEVEIMSSSPDDQRLNKKWGYITALPSEYLIHFKKGRLSQKTSGQGAVCFKWPRDTIFIIPTSLKEIAFQANQLTSDNVDVRIRGMAVYRISDPLKIYKLINFLHRQKAEEKLAKMIGDMCRSTSKWLVSNMYVEECLRKRKEEIAESLKREISMVVSHPEKGWGTEIITIDINDVYIQDEEVFDAMQMQFKNEKIRESELSKIEMEKEIELKRIETEKYLAEHRKETEINKTRIEAAIKEEQITLARQNDEQQYERDKNKVEQNEKIANFKLDQKLQREQEEMKIHVERKQKEVECQRMAAEQALNALQQRINVENNASQVSNERLFYEKTLPGVTEKVASSLKSANLTLYNQNSKDGTVLPFNIIFSEIVNLLKTKFTTKKE